MAHAPAYIGVHRRRGLNTFAEGDDTLRLSKGHSLDDVVTVLLSVRDYRKLKFFIDIGAKMAPFNADAVTVGARKSPW